MYAGSKFPVDKATANAHEQKLPVMLDGLARMC